MSTLRPPLTAQRRDVMSAAERERLEAAGALVRDRRLSRPRYFDGRFLAARDLTADQDYLAARLADQARASGAGIVRGLDVQGGTHASEVRVTAGLGTTPSGEAVILPATMTLDLLSLRQAELLDASLGLRRTRTAPTRVRTGPFVLALRPVEYTANPHRGYPTTLQGPRTVEDHDIVEAAAFTLVPYPTRATGSADEVRRALAREIFVLQTGAGLAADLLPLAMVYLDGVSVRWVDTNLVRRMVGAEQEDLLGLGVASRSRRLAFVRQFGDHLHAQVSHGGPRAIAATEAFDALPPVGRIPATCLDRTRFTQSFFPAEVDVDVSFVPDDELPIIVEDSLLLPPIDLEDGAEALAGVSVLLLVPVPRQTLRAFKATLTTVRRPLVRRIARAPTVRTPLLALSRLRLPSTAPAVAAATPADTATAAWTNLLEQAIAAGDGWLWYARRRNVDNKAEILGNVVDIDGGDA